MMNKLLVVLFLLPLFAFSQRESVLIKSPIFTIVYNEKYQQPLKIKYSVSCADGKASRKGMDFYEVDSVITSNSADYSNNIYDKGHMAPAAAFSCSVETLKQTFSYLNCALQDQYLNRGVWRLLEERERQLYKENGIIHVEIDVSFEGTPVTLATGARVPSGFTKIITIQSNGKVEKYYFPNLKPKSNDYNTYKIK